MGLRQGSGSEAPAVLAEDGGGSPPAKSTVVLFHLLVASLCIWILSLPLLPTQDGPMHLYYVSVIRHLSHNDALFTGFFKVRDAMTPYLLQYGLLSNLTEVFPAALSEKLVACFIILLSCYGFYALAYSFGDKSNVAGLWMAPMFLSWPLFMGFHNYCLSLGLMLWTWAAWNQVRDTKAWGWGWIWLVLSCFGPILVMLAHPVPLLFLVTIYVADLIRRAYREWRPFPEGYRMAIVQLIIVFGCIGVVVSAVHAASGVQSPYTVPNLASNMASFVGLRWLCVESGGLGMAVHRLILGTLFILVVIFGSGDLLGRVRRRDLRPGDVPLVLSVLLFVALPFVPQEFNGLAFFSNRMLLFDWVLALAALSSFKLSRDQIRIGRIAALCSAVFVLFLVDRAVRPMANGLDRIAQTIQLHGTKALLFDGAQPGTAKAVTFNPYLSLSAGRYLAKAGVLLVNDPFTDPPNILPVIHARSEIQRILSPSERLYQKVLHEHLQQEPALRLALLPKVDTIIFAVVAGSQGSTPDPLIAEDAQRGWQCRQYQTLNVCEAPPGQKH